MAFEKDFIVNRGSDIISEIAGIPYGVCQVVILKVEHHLYQPTY